MLLELCEVKNTGWIIWASIYYFKCSACSHVCSLVLWIFIVIIVGNFFDNASQALIKKIKGLLLWAYLKIAKHIYEKRKKKLLKAH